MIRQISIISIGLIFISCNLINEDKYIYPKDSLISNHLGVPYDSLTFYYPAVFHVGSKIEYTQIDTFMYNWFSSNLHSAHEPILFNYYLGHDIYRFLWLRSFDRPVVISIHKNNEKVWLETRILDKQPEFYDSPPPPVLLNNSIQQSLKKDEPFKYEYIIRKLDRQANIVLNQIIVLTNDEWTEFEKLIADCLFWTDVPLNEDIMGFDGSFWTFEGHLSNHYRCVIRWSPDDCYRVLGKYLINKSELEEKIY